MIDVTPLSNVAGARVAGLDLRTPFTPELRDTVERALVQHHVLVFPRQQLSTHEQARFTEQFGELESHVIRLRDGKPPPPVHVMTNLDENGQPTDQLPSQGIFHWHSDKSYHAIPSLATLLHAIQVPPTGGDTQFANMALAYAELDDELKEQIAHLNVEHSWAASRKNTGSRLATEDEIRERPPVTQPLVRTHPDTGVKSLYLGMHASHVLDMDYDEGRALLAELLEFATQPKFVYTHQWTAGELVMWDNRSLLHRAVPNYEMQRFPRVMHRTVVKGRAAVE